MSQSSQFADSGGGTSGHEPGSVADELRSLLDTMASRAEPLLHKVRSTGRAADGHQHTPATCNWCPLCAALALVRGERPELAVRAAEHAAGLLAVLRAALADGEHEQHTDPAGGTAAEEPWHAGHAAERTPASAEEPSARRQRVQRIDLRRPSKADGD